MQLIVELHYTIVVHFVYSFLHYLERQKVRLDFYFYFEDGRINVVPYLSLYLEGYYL